jgi:hypothetical protein
MVFKPKKRSEEQLKKTAEVDEEEFEEELEVPTPEPKNKVVQKQPEKTEDESVELIWSAEEIPTATSVVIFNAKENKTYSLMEAIAELLNRTE